MQLLKCPQLFSAIFTNLELRYGYCNRSITLTVLENGRSPANQTKQNIKHQFRYHRNIGYLHVGTLLHPTTILVWIRGIVVRIHGCRDDGIVKSVKGKWRTR
jgi:hypothetical protein